MNTDKSSIMFLGDSITKGIGWVDGKYRELENSFFNTFSKTVFSSTINKGRFGQTSRKCLKGIDRITEAHPEMIFFEIGGNDCNFNWKEIAEHPDEEHLPAVSKEEFETNLCSIYDSFNKNGVKVITMNLPPLHAEKFFNFLTGYFNGANIKKWLKNVSRIYYHHESYNKIFENVTREYGFDMIDIRSRFLMDDNLEDLVGVDGMHPLPAGHDLIYKSISDHLLSSAIG